jgi:hypothetical protein
VQVHAVRRTRAGLERFNDAIMERVALGRRARWLPGRARRPVQMFLTFPPRFDPQAQASGLAGDPRRPVRGAGDTFSYRWNTHLLASRGHVVASVNYHGSSGFGHASPTASWGAWASSRLRDIEAGTDWLLAQPWADREARVRGGRSYGGFSSAG